MHRAFMAMTSNAELDARDIWLIEDVYESRL